MKLRRIGLAILIFVAAILAIDAVIWHWTVSTLAQRLQEGEADAAVQGWHVRTGSPARAGWPLAATIALPDVTVTADPAAFPGGLVWSAGRVRIELAALSPKTLHVRADGQQGLQLAGLPPVPFRTRTTDFAAALDGAVPPSLSIAGLEAALPAGKLQVTNATLHFPANTVLLDAGDVAIPAGRALGPAIDSLHLRTVLTRPFPQAPTPAAQARAWRDAGGRVEVQEFGLRWGPLTVTGRATGGLDGRLQPQADGVLSVAGATRALDALAQAGVVPGGTATAVKAVLTLLAAPAPNAPVQLPVQFRDGVLVIARFPLLRLPPLDWGPG